MISTSYIKRKWYNFTHPKLGVILMLHRVIPQRSLIQINRDIEMTPSFLEKTIHEYQERNYQFVSLDEVYDILTGKLRLKKPFVCFTFDDGYKDNYEVAYPIFRKYNCPFTVYVTTDFYEYNAIVWWYVLEDIIMEHSQITLSDGTHFRTGNIEEKNEAFKIIHQRITALDPIKIASVFSDWFQNYEFSFEQKIRDLSLSKDELKILSKDELCTIGSHTVAHPVLANLTDDRQKDEILESKTQLEQLIGKKIRHFAYPFGNFNEQSISLVEKSGYSTAVMAWGGNVRKGQIPFLLKRIFLKEA